MIKPEQYFKSSSNLEKNNILVGLAFEIRDLLAQMVNPVGKTAENKPEKVLTHKEFKSGPRSRHKRKNS